MRTYTLRRHDISHFDRVQGAYWYFADHHRGQGSPEYQALSALTEVYSPGIGETGPDVDTGAEEFYMELQRRWRKS